MVTIPTIETKRLRLRAAEARDLDVVAEFFADERSRYVGGPKDRFDSWRSMCAALGQWHLCGYGLWHAEDIATGAVVGCTGIFHPDGWPEPELGYHLFNGFERQGYALEMAEAARDYACTHFGLCGVISLIQPANTASIRLVEKLGATYEKDMDVFGLRCHVYRHQTPEAAT